jgi:uncharacterized damage-inducible protein DinB
MTQKQMVTEKDMFLQTFDRECQITSKILKAYPANKADLKPAEKLRTAKELAWTFVGEQAVADMAFKGKIDFSQPGPKPPATFQDIITTFEKTYRETLAKVSKASDEQLAKMVQFPVGPGKMGDFRVQDVLWMLISDQVHHRGQLSVYVRIAGAKLPSIYGPTADETWM